MKKTAITLFLFCTAIISNAQSFDVSRANKYFNRAFYAEAIPLYEKNLNAKTTYEAAQNLADSYYFLNNMGKASLYYKYLLSNYENEAKDEVYFRYANSLKAIGKSKSANAILKEYYSKKGDTKSLKKLSKEIQYLENVTAIGNRYSLENLAINTENSEFGAVEKNETLVFSAIKKEENFLEKMYGWNNQPYLDLYQIPLDKIGLGNDNSKSLSAKINTKVHESNAIFTKDGKTVYFTRNNYINNKRKRDRDKVTHIQIFKAELIDDNWAIIQSLPFNNIAYSTEHPALSLDEKMLYFASDMPGGFGSFDIYAVSIFDNDNFGKPKNLGETINTNKREQFPFISKNNELYFSSDGHAGFGSLDVFISHFKNNQYSKPDNVGLPINSGYDDFAFNINTTTKEGYFSSNRTSGKGSDDIYKITEKKPLIIEDCKQTITVTASDIDTKQALANTILIFKNGLMKADSVQTDANGKFVFNTACKISYTIVASKEEYQQKKKFITINTDRKKNNTLSLALKSLKAIEKEKNIAIQLKKEKDLKLKIAIEKKNNIAVKLKKEKASKLRTETAEKLKLDKKDKIERIITAEKSIEKNKDRILVKTEDINFDYKLWYLRGDTKRTIDKVIALMKRHQNMVIEIGTHSDIRGKDSYNLKLSQKRANSVKNYFLEKGIELDRISAVGYGETQPLIKCKTEESCTEQQHEMNRRCEFIIKQID